uniref:Uncharacterized protein n=1 Tax=Triticum urartu TaxID=4572 RepID=A0A8R7P105_TRIUA
MCENTRPRQSVCQRFWTLWYLTLRCARCISAVVLDGGVGLDHGGDEGDERDDLDDDGPRQREVVPLHVGPHDVQRVAAPLPQLLQQHAEVARHQQLAAGRRLARDAHRPEEPRHGLLGLVARAAVLLHHLRRRQHPRVLRRLHHLRHEAHVRRHVHRRLHRRRRRLLERHQIQQQRRRAELDPELGEVEPVLVLRQLHRERHGPQHRRDAGHRLAPAAGARLLELHTHALQVARRRHVFLPVARAPLLVLGEDRVQQRHEQQQRDAAQQPCRLLCRLYHRAVLDGAGRRLPPCPRRGDHRVEQVQDVGDPLGRRQLLAHVAALLAGEVVQHELHEQHRRGVPGGLELRQLGAGDEINEYEEGHLVLGEDEVDGELRGAEGRGVQRRLLVARGDVDEVLDDEAAVEHHHLDELIGGNLGDVLPDVHRPGLLLAGGDDADVPLDDGEVLRRVGVAAGDEAVEVRHLEPLGGAEAPVLAAVERADGDEPRRVVLGVVVAEVEGDAGQPVAGRHGPVLLLRRHALLLLHQGARQIFDVHRDVPAAATTATATGAGHA